MMYHIVYRIMAPVSRYVSYREKMYRCSPTYFLGKKGNINWESESLKLPTALSDHAAYFCILAVYFKT